MNDLLTRTNEIGFISVNNELPEYGWYRTANDAFLNLGSIKKAVVIRKALHTTKYFISTGSYFPFGVKIYDARYDSIDEAVKEANCIIAKWLYETYNFLGSTDE